jgi:hypothetical protein
MTTMVTELYDALRDAQGVSDEKARKAAEAMANYDDQFSGLERKIDGVDRKIDLVQSTLERKIDALRAELSLQKWMLGTLIAFALAATIKTLIH